MRRFAILACIAAAMLALTACSEKAECLAEFYTFEQSPGEVTGDYRGLEFTSLLSADLTANGDGDTGTMSFTGEGAGGGDDDDSAADDDDDSAADDDDSADGARDYEYLTQIDTWQINVQWEDTNPLGQRTDGQYALKPSGSDCATHGNKCFEAQMSFNGEQDSERWLLGRLELFDPAEGLRGCMFLMTADGDDEADLDIYFTQ
jgi:hypothetical protein